MGKHAVEKCHGKTIMKKPVMENYHEGNCHEDTAMGKKMSWKTVMRKLSWKKCYGKMVWEKRNSHEEKGNEQLS